MLHFVQEPIGSDISWSTKWVLPEPPKLQGFDQGRHEGRHGKLARRLGFPVSSLRYRWAIALAWTLWHQRPRQLPDDPEPMVTRQHSLPSWLQCHQARYRHQGRISGWQEQRDADATFHRSYKIKVLDIGISQKRISWKLTQHGHISCPW